MQATYAFYEIARKLDLDYSISSMYNNVFKVIVETVMSVLLPPPSPPLPQLASNYVSSWMYRCVEFYGGIGFLYGI